MIPATYKVIVEFDDADNGETFTTTITVYAQQIGRVGANGVKADNVTVEFDGKVKSIYAE